MKINYIKLIIILLICTINNISFAQNYRVVSTSPPVTLKQDGCSNSFYAPCLDPFKSAPSIGSIYYYDASVGKFFHSTLPDFYQPLDGPPPPCVLSCEIFVSATASPSTISLGQSSTLTANISGTYNYNYLNATWSNGYQGINNVVTPSTTTTYSVTVTDYSEYNCSAVTTVTVYVNSNPCSVSLNATPSSCNSSTNQYSVSGYLSITNPPQSGTLTVSGSGGGSQTFYAPFSSSIPYSISGLNADGGSHSVTATFSDNSSCYNSAYYTAPANCQNSPCSVDLTATPSSCNSSTNQYSVYGNIALTNPPSSGTLTVSVSGGGSQTFYAPFSSSLVYNITGLTADGSIHTVTATFSNNSTCTNSTSYLAPTSCMVSTCSVDLTATPSSCNSSTNQYSVYGNIALTNPPSSGTLTVNVSGGGSQTFYAPFSSSLSYNISGLAADGNTHIVSVSFSANSSCSNSTFYTAPSSCINYSCTVSLTAIPSTCNPATNTYTLTGRAEIFNGVGGSIIVISDGTNSQSYTVPNSQTSITWVDYTLTGLTANGSIHTVTAVVSNGSSCQGSTTYTAPVSCLSGPCSISLTSNASVCNSSNNQYSVYGNISVTNPPSSGSLTVSVSGGGSYTFYAPFSNTIPYNIFGLNSDGALHTVTASFSDNSSCSNSTFYFAPTTCNTLSCSATITANPGSCNSATNQYTLNGSVSVTNPPNSGLLTIQVIGGSSQYYSLPLTFPLSYSFSGLNSDGLSHSVEISISGVNCSNTATYNAPTNCSLNCTLSTNCSSTAQTSCNSSNGTATVNVTGGQGNLFYNWSNGGNTATITGLSAGVYTVTVTDNILSGCSSVCSVTVSNSMILPSASCSSTNNTNCNTPNGTASVSTNANQILWSNGSTSATIAGLSAGTYTVTVTNSSTGCTNTCSTTVGISATLPFVICSKTDNSNCLTPNGTASVSTNANQIQWSNGGTSTTITGLSAGTYTVTVTNTATGCSNTCSVILNTLATLPTAICSKIDNSNCLIPNGSATVSTNANLIHWSTGSTSSTIAGLSAGTYTVTVTNSATGCTNTCYAIVGTSATLPTATCSKTDNSNCSTPNGSATVSTNANQILWSNGGTTATISGLSAGIYTVTVTSSVTGCTNTCSVTVATAATLPTVTCSKTDNSNCSTPNGSATVSTNANQILWSTGSTSSTITGLSAGTYTVTVTSSVTGCTNTCSVTVATAATLPTATCSKTDNSNCSNPNGTATVSTNANQILWSNGGTTTTISGLSAGTYTVTVTSSATGCTNICSAIVGTSATLPTATCSKTDNSNCSIPNGTATVSTNANQILWSNGGNTTTISGLSAGTYTVTVTSSVTGCTNTCSTIVGNTASTLNVNCTSVNPTCSSTNGGSVTSIASGGIGSYSYIWSNGSTGQSINGLIAGTYSVTVTDGNNCKSTCSANLILPQGCCSISTDGLVIGNCNNKNTFANSSDDEYTFTLNPTGTGIGSSYTVTGLPNSPNTGNYGNPTTFGPYLISSGVKNITITDNTSTGCSKTVIITPPQSCSNCNLAPPVITVTDNICPSRVGNINITNSCGNNTQIQFSTNNGINWSNSKPLYSTTAITIKARCVSISDTTCKSSITTVTTSPKKCNLNTNECTLSVNTTINSCSNNKTDNNLNDDYFTIQVNATSTNGGSSNRYEIVSGANLTDGTGGNVLNSGGTLYNSSVIVGQNKIFSANGISNYQLLVRDYDNNSCFKIIDISPIAPCSTNNNFSSPCYPTPCVPISIQKN